MPNYLTKEEIRQWRSSLEKITLEEFAARLGKSVEESKPTNDVVDIVMSKGTSSTTNTNVNDGFSAIAERAFKRERQISHTPFSINKKEMQNESKPAQEIKTVKKEDVLKDIVNQTLSKPVAKTSNKKEETVLEKVEELSANSAEINIVLKKSLTDREQLVFEYFLNNIGKTVFAKDLAELLELPRDYVYKYIKNLRAKIEGDKLRNVPSGGFVLAEN
ncbi:MAG: helix-turn-helix domain-containing protein [Candidatus Gastranaerophilales bacterium]|nr:helix-turn-helix domain-containing protein [Candidatus Gastranaerophilales bacterium]